VEPRSPSGLKNLAVWREKAIGFLVAGADRRAAEIFGEILDGQPFDVASVALRDLAVRRIEAASKDDARLLGAMVPKQISGFADGHALFARAPAPPAGPVPVLSVEKIEAHAGRFKDFARRTRGLPGRPETLPQQGDIPSATARSDHDVYAFALDPIVAFSARDGAPLEGLDFGSVQLGPAAMPGKREMTRVTDAAVIGRTAIVALGNCTVIRPPALPDCYLGAFDLDTGSIYWWSDPFVAGPFLVTGGYAVGCYSPIDGGSS
jgi:hypothetical protein